MCVAARRVNVTFSYDVYEERPSRFHLTFSGLTLLIFFTSDSDPHLRTPRFLERTSLSLSLSFSFFLSLSVLVRGVYTYRRSLEDKSKFVHEYLWERFVGTVVHKVLHLTVLRLVQICAEFHTSSRRNFYDTDGYYFSFATWWSTIWKEFLDRKNS